MGPTIGGGAVDTARADPEWEELVLRAPGGHHVQTTAWARVRSALGARFERITVRDDDRIVAGAQLQLLDLPVLGTFGVGVGAPVIATDDPTTRQVLARALVEWTRAPGHGGILLHPQTLDADLEHALEAESFRTSPITPRLAATAVFDLGDGSDEVVSLLPSKTRYNVRVGLRRGVDVRIAGEEGPEVFAELLRSTADRQGFENPMSARELRLLTEEMTDRPIAKIFLAEVEGEAVSGALLIGHGTTAVYKRGAWNGAHGDAHPNEVMHATMMEWARDRGFTLYDFDGMDPDIARRLAAGEKPKATGVTRFKLKFGARPQMLPPARFRLKNPLLSRGSALLDVLPSRAIDVLERWTRSRW